MAAKCPPAKAEWPGGTSNDFGEIFTQGKKALGLACPLSLLCASSIYANLAQMTLLPNEV